MTYTKRVNKFSKRKLSIGDKIRAETKDKKFRGILMPNPDEDGLVIKLENGYNRFVPFNKIQKIIRKKKGEDVGKIPSVKKKKDKKLPNVVIVSTGGTIGTHVDYKTGGVFMCRTPEQILSTVPEISDVINITKMENPFTVASEDMTPEHWEKVCEIVGKHAKKKSVDGIIVTMGTDTMHYLSAALSFTLPKLSKPVAVVGAQRSPDRGSFDGKMNLLCAAQYCRAGIKQVATVMHGSTSDDYCLAIKGTKVRKMHSSRRDAFRPINEPPVAKLWPGREPRVINPPGRADNKTELVNGFKKVGLVKAYPGSDPSILDWHVKKGYKGIIIEGTGLGHVPTGKSSDNVKLFDEKKSWLPKVKKAVKKGVVVGVTSQTIYGKVNPYVYRNLRLLKEAGAVFCEDMHSETAMVKLSWLLANKPKKAGELLNQDLVGEINERRIEKTFLY